MSTDFTFLSTNFYVVTKPQQQLLISIPVTQLLQPGQTKKFLQKYGSLIKTSEPKVAAVLLTGWISGLCACHQYMISHYNAVYDFSLERLTLQINNAIDIEDGVEWLLSSKDPLIYISDEGGRDEWRARSIQFFYLDSIAPLLKSLALAAGLPESTLWRQLPHWVISQHDQSMEAAVDESLRTRLIEDFAYLQGNSGALLGSNRNPYRISLPVLPHPRRAGATVRQKASCCLAYRTEADVGYCYTCPRMTEEDRMKRLHAL